MPSDILYVSILDLAETHGVWNVDVQYTRGVGFAEGTTIHSVAWDDHDGFHTTRVEQFLEASGLEFEELLGLLTSYESTQGA